MSITIKYDFFSSDTLTELDQIFDMCGVSPLSINIDYISQFDNVSVEFVDQKDAILFSEVYLGSTDPSDVREYVGSETPLGQEVYGG